MPWVLGAPVRITVPGPPMALERNRHRIVTPRGKPSFVSNFLPAKSRSEQAVLREFADKAMAGRVPFGGAIDIRYVAYMPVPMSWSKRDQVAALAGHIRPTGRPDFDNLIKMAADAFKGIVWRDDAQITDAAIWKRYADRPRLAIEVRELTWVAEASEPV